jgi:hypothetical protein
VLFPPPVVEAKAKRMSKCKTENDEMAIEAPEATFNNSTLEEQLMDLIEFQPGLTAMGGISLWHNGMQKFLSTITLKYIYLTLRLPLYKWRQR